MRALEQLRRKEGAWLKARWAYLAMGLGMLVLTWFNFKRQAEILEALVQPGGERFNPVFVPLLARGAVIHHITLISAVVLLAYTFANWRGSAVRKLIIRLCADHRDA